MITSIRLPWSDDADKPSNSVAALFHHSIRLFRSSATIASGNADSESRNPRTALAILSFLFSALNVSSYDNELEDYNSEFQPYKEDMIYDIVDNIPANINITPM